jgi:hypothetical protein
MAGQCPTRELPWLAGESQWITLEWASQIAIHLSFKICETNAFLNMLVSSPLVRSSPHLSTRNLLELQILLFSLSLPSNSTLHTQTSPQSKHPIDTYACKSGTEKAITPCTYICIHFRHKPVPNLQFTHLTYCDIPCDVCSLKPANILVSNKVSGNQE